MAQNGVGGQAACPFDAERVKKSFAQSLPFSVLVCLDGAMQETLRWKAKVSAAISGNCELETWESQTHLRLLELERVERLLKEGELGDFLELGCGNGIGSAYLSVKARHVTATDLGVEDPSTHTIGLKKVERVFETLGVMNATIKACSAEELPFENVSFDTVFSMHCLEHVPDRAKALKECYRVLKPCGRIVMVVPTSAWSWFYPLGFYAELIGRNLKKIRRKKKAFQTGATGVATEPPKRVVKDWGSFRKAYPHFPLPEPHGAYPSYFHEVFLQNPRWWRGHFKRTGFTQVSAFPLSVVPRGALESIFGNWGWNLYKSLEPVDKALCKTPGAGWVAQVLCVVAKK